MTTKAVEELEQNAALLESVAAAMAGNKPTSLPPQQAQQTQQPPPPPQDGGVDTPPDSTEKMAVEAKQQAHNAVSTPLETNPTEIVHTDFVPVVEVTENVQEQPTPRPEGSEGPEVQVNTTTPIINHVLIPQNLTHENKLDIVLNKLDEVFTRLDRIEAMIGMKSASLSRIGKPKIHHGPGTSTAKTNADDGTPIHEINLHFYDNEYHVLPQGWLLPKLNFEGLMQFWYLGDATNGVPPLIKVGGTEFKNIPRGVRKRSDMKYLMKHVERKGREMGCFLDNVSEWTLDSVRNLFHQTRQHFEYPNKSSTQTKFEKLSWETVCHNLRRNKGILVGEDPHQIEAEEMEHPVPIPQADSNNNVVPVVHNPQEEGVGSIAVLVSNQNPLAPQEESNDVVMEERGEEASSSEKEQTKTMML